MCGWRENDAEPTQQRTTAKRGERKPGNNREKRKLAIPLWCTKTSTLRQSVELHTLATMLLNLSFCFVPALTCAVAQSIPVSAFAFFLPFRHTCLAPDRAHWTAEPPQRIFTRSNTACSCPGMNAKRATFPLGGVWNVFSTVCAPPSTVSVWPHSLQGLLAEANITFALRIFGGGGRQIRKLRFWKTRNTDFPQNNRKWGRDSHVRGKIDERGNSNVWVVKTR